MVAIFSGGGTGLERGSARLLGEAAFGRSGEQLFVNAATGNLLIGQRDEFLVGRGPDAAVARTYNSLGNFSDENADNWRQSTDRRVHTLLGGLNTAGSTLRRVSGDGSEIVYRWDAARAAYLATDGDGAYDTLVHSAGVWTWTDGDSRVTERYAAHGVNNWRIVEQADTDGNLLRFTYTGAQLARITTADGGWIQYGWSGNNIVELVTGYADLVTGTPATLTRTRYGYDASNRLSTVTVDLSPGDNSVADGRKYVTTYVYDGASKRVKAILETDGSRIDFAYDAAGRITRFAQTISGAGATLVPRVTSLTYGAGHTIVTDFTGAATRLDYDPDGALRKITAPPAHAGAAAQTTQFAYTANGDVASVTDALGNVTSFTYDAMGNALTATDRLGNVVTRSYGARNQLLTETRTASNEASASAALTTRFVYDAENHLRYRIDPRGGVTEYRYTPAGQLQDTIDYPAHLYPVGAPAPSEAQVDAWRDALADRSSVRIVSNAYDARGNLVTTTSHGAATAAGLPLATEGQSRTDFVHDQAGQLLARHAPGENPVRYVYDGLGRIVAATDMSGGTTSIVFADAATTTIVTLASGLVQTSTYDKTGGLLGFTEAGNLVIGGTDSYVRDSLGRVRMVTDSAGGKRYHLYDRLGRKTADINHYGDVVEYRYDAADRLVATVRYAMRPSAAALASLADPKVAIEVAAIRPPANAGDLWTWRVHDSEGRLAEAIEGDGSVTAYDYDGAGNLVRTVAYANRLTAAQLAGFKTAAPAARVLPAADPARDQVARSFYDGNGRLAGALDGEGYLTRIVYDAGGRKTEEIAHAGATPAALRASGSLAQLIAATPATPGDRRTRYAYDGRGLLRYVVDALNQVVEHGYDAAGRRTSTTAYAGSIAAAADHGFATIKALVAASGLASSAATRRSWAVHDAAGRLAFAIDAENAVTGFAYDANGQVAKTVQYAATRPTTAAPALATMTAWAAGQANNAANRVTRTYHNARGELRFVVDAEGYLTRREYDAEGRMTREVRWAGALAVTDATPAAALAGSGDYVDVRQAWDGAGRLVYRWEAAGEWREFVYSANGTLAADIAARSSPDEVRTRFEYDGAGRVVARYAAYGTPDQAETRFAYDGLGNRVSVTDSNGNTTSYAHDLLGRELARIDALGGVWRSEYNAFGDVVRTVDALGNATINHYDNLGRLTAIRDAEDFVTEQSYDSFGGLVTIVRRTNRATNAASPDALPAVAAHAGDAVTRMAYDRLGRLVSLTDAEGHYEHYTLNAFGQRSAVRNKLGGITTNVFDRRGLLTAETLPIDSTDAQGVRVASTVTNRFEYDSRGNRIRSIEAAGLAEARTTAYVYDKRDRVIEIRGDAVAVLSQANHSSVTTLVPVRRFRYDLRGNLIETLEANGARTLCYYDRLDRKIAQIDALGVYSAWSYDKNGNLVSSRVYGLPIAFPAAAGGAPPPVPGAPGAQPAVIVAGSVTPPATPGEVRETLYAYDRLNRRITSSIAGVRTGAWNGTSYATSVVTITTRYQYDAFGNLVREIDAGGAGSWSYYDKLGRKVAQVDRENYLTSWRLDAQGNVAVERRYATRAASFGIAAPPTVATSADDRETLFAYDRNGRRLSETRTGVRAWTVNAQTGALAAAPTSSTVGYAYNGLGQVTRKTEANGDAVAYEYDAGGRLVRETRAAFTGVDGAASPTVRYYYNGLGNLMLTRQGDAALAARDRMTRYSYAAGGRLASMTDAAGGVFSYQYDAAGNVLRQSYARRRSDGSFSDDSILYVRDLLGRVIEQGIASWTGSAWAKGDRQNTGYNAYGEVSQSGVNGLWQTRSAYDAAGRLWRSNAGDGVWRFFVHDAAGNRTLTLESEGLDLAGLTIEQVLATATGPTGTVGSSLVDGLNATIVRFDKRGQAIETREPRRELRLGADPVDLVTRRSYTAFGEVASETNALGALTSYAYNTMGRTLSVQQASVWVTLEDGTRHTERPISYFFHDAAGRLIGSQDANGKAKTRLLLAGTGHGGSEALATVEFQPDGGIARYGYDVFGDQRSAVDEIGRETQMAYDAMGRLTRITRANGLVESFSYDILGQRLRHWNSLLGAANYEATDYDVQGRVTYSRAFGGDETTIRYLWSSTLATDGMGVFGGWTTTTTYANSRTLEDVSDLFGRNLRRKDLGGHVFAYSYDLAGRLTDRTGGETLGYTYFNTGRVAQVFAGSALLKPILAKRVTTYGYDAAGNVTSESLVEHSGALALTLFGPLTPLASKKHQNATATYDALGRMTSYIEAGSADMPAAAITYQYDAVGNVRRTQAEYRVIDAKGVPAATASVQDYWYRYDAANRVVTSQGTLVNGQIVRGKAGVDIGYDKAGQRIRTQRTLPQSVILSYPFMTVLIQVKVDYEVEYREDYGYDPLGNLASVRIAQGGYTPNPNGTVNVTPPPATGALKASYTYDAMGRLTRQIDWAGNGADPAYDRSVVYNAKGQIESETAITKQGSTYFKSVTSFEYGSGTGYALGSIVSSQTVNHSGSTLATITKALPTTSTANSFFWYDGAVQASVTYKPDVSKTPANTSSYAYNGWGQLTSVTIDDGRDRTVSFVNDLAGQVLRRDEADASASKGDPHEVWYRFAGEQLGYVGNNGTMDTSYQVSIANRGTAQGFDAFRFGSAASVSYADFDQSYDGITSYEQGAPGGSYTVQSGDTLSSIAASLWGDASLWFRLAEANGMTAATALVEGQRLTVPSGVLRSTNTASTFNPYDPAEALGDTSPTAPKKPATKKKKCGGILGQILVVVIAVAVTVLTQGAAIAAWGPLLGGAASAAAGSVASQAFGLATGIQDSFSWKGVALAAISGGVTGGAGAAFPEPTVFGNQFLGNAVRGALANAVTQGIGVVTGLQPKFDWVGVAAAGAVAGVAGEVGGRLRGRIGEYYRAANGDLVQRATPSFSNALVSNMAGAIAGAASQTVLAGTSFGDNVLAALPAAIGSTIGNAIGQGLTHPDGFARGFGWESDRRRGLTAGERGMAERAFGAGIDLRGVQLVEGSGNNLIAYLAFALGGARAITLGDTIYFNDSLDPIDGVRNWADFTVDSKDTYLLSHELEHVRQYQGAGFFSVVGSIVGSSVIHGSSGAYEYYNRNTTFAREPLEGQASIVGDYVRYVEHGVLRGVEGLSPTYLRQRLEMGIRGSGIYGN